MGAENDGSAEEMIKVRTPHHTAQRAMLTRYVERCLNFETGSVIVMMIGDGR